MFCSKIENQDTHLKKDIPADIKLAVTIYNLAKSASFTAIEYHWQIGKGTTRQIIYETCDVIGEELMSIFVSQLTVQQGKDIAVNFAEKWDSALCFGALDSKHIRIQPPSNSGTETNNYKHDH